MELNKNLEWKEIYTRVREAHEPADRTETDVESTKGVFVRPQNKKSTKQMAFEGAVIVLSILLAFAIEAWWGERLERLEETEILLGLKQEFLDNQATIENQVTRHHAMVDAIGQLMEASQKGRWEATGPELDSAISRLITPPTTDLGNGVLEALVSAGRIELLQNKDLRFRIAGWKGIFNEALDDEIMNRNLVFDRVIPYFMQWGVPLSGPLSNFGYGWPIATRSIFDDPEALSRLLSDPEFATIVETRFGYLLHTTEEYQTALDEIERILIEIDRSISG